MFMSYINSILRFDFSPMIEKMRNKTLTLEDVLNNNELVNDLKTNSPSEFEEFFTPEILKELINYCIKMPKYDTYEAGHKFPFNACEILCSGNGLNIQKFLRTYQKKDSEGKDDEYEGGEDRFCNEGDVENKDREDEIEKENDDDIQEEDQRNKGNNGNKSDEETEDKQEEIADKKEETEDKQEETEEKQDETADKKEESTDKQEETEDKQEETEDKQEEIADKKEETEDKQEETEDKQISQKAIENSENQETPQETSGGYNPQHHEKNLAMVCDLEPKNEQDYYYNNTDEAAKTEVNHQTEIESDPEQKPYNLKQLYDVLDHLFSFLQAPSSDDNYVWMGYFSKILNSLVNDKPEIILKYLFKDGSQGIKSLIKHLNRKAITNVLETIIFTLNYDIVQCSSWYKIPIITAVLDELISENTDSNGIEFACEWIDNSIISSTKTNFETFIFSEDWMGKLNKCVSIYISKEDHRKVIPLIRLLIKINETLLKHVVKKVTPNFSFGEAENEIVNIIKSIDRGESAFDSYQNINAGKSQGGNLMNSNYERIFKTLTLNTKIIVSDIVGVNKTVQDTGSIQNSYCETAQKRLGMKAIVQWEYLRTILDIIVNSASSGKIEELGELIDTLIKTEWFSKLIETYICFGLTNIFQNIFSQIITIAINKSTPKEVVLALFESKHQGVTLVELWISDIHNNNKFTFESEKTMNSFLFAINCDLWIQIFKSVNEPLVEYLNQNEKWMFFNERFIKIIDQHFSKKWMWKDGNTADDNGKICESINPKFDINDKKDSIASFSKKSFTDIIDFNLSIYNKYLNNDETYKDLIKQAEEEEWKELNEQEFSDTEQDDNFKKDYDEENVFETRMCGAGKEVETRDDDDEEEYEGETNGVVGKVMNGEINGEDEQKFSDFDYWKKPFSPSVKEVDEIEECLMNQL